MLHGEHSAILSTFIKLSFVIKVFVLSVFEWPLKTVLLCMDFATINVVQYINLSQSMWRQITIISMLYDY